VKQSVGVTAFGPGKVILLGEHGVVYGHPALAASIARGVRAWAEPAQQTVLELPEGLSDGHREALERAFARAAGQAGFPKVSVHLESDVPLSMGLGSSGALSVAISRVLLPVGAPVKRVEALAFEMEKEFHGTPSGVDHTTSARDALIFFKRGAVRALRPVRPLSLVIALVPGRASTKVTVASLRERQARWRPRYAKVFEHIASLVDVGAKAAVQGDLQTLGDVMNMNQGLLSALGLSSARLEQAVYALRAAGALGAKLTGAGGDGGAVIGLFDDPVKAVVKLRRAGLDCFASSLGGAVS
jgi:mevalonate kinase